MGVHQPLHEIFLWDDRWFINCVLEYLDTLSIIFKIVMNTKVHKATKKFNTFLQLENTKLVGKLLSYLKY